MVDEENDESNINEFDEWIEENEDESILVQSLFCDESFRTINEMLAYDFKIYNFDIKMFLPIIGADEISLIMLVNFIRKKVSTSSQTSIDYIDEIKNDIMTKTFLDDDTYMMPIIKNDPMLYLLKDSLLQTNPELFSSEENEDLLDQNRLIVPQQLEEIRKRNPNYDYINDYLTDDI